VTDVDQAGAIRAGEELDLAGLSPYLAERLGVAPGDIEVRQFPHGHSNLTYLVRARNAEYVLRRPPFGNRVKTAHDMSREFRVLSALAPVFDPAPRPVLLCEDPGVIGAPFYLMERRGGSVIRRVLPPELAEAPERAGRLCGSMVDTLAALHAIDYRAVGLGDFGRPEGYVTRQVNGWTERYRAAATHDLPDMELVAEWLAGRMPAEGGRESRAAVIHNDFKFDNVMVAADDPSRIVAVLDWEMATIGDPLMDLGSALAYWIEPGDPEPVRQAAMGPTAAPGMWSRRQLIEAYAARSGRSLGDLSFYYVFGVFKLAVIIQQIYARFARGYTTDPRFARMHERVAVLAEQAARATAG
jgi:aminoglycoside phosphotransferase (APT) family kinase protein